MRTFTDFSQLALAKDRVRIPDLGSRFFPAWRPGRSCLSPFRADQKPSFSVFGDGHRWKDFATGEGGDSVDFLAKARGLTKGAAAHELIDLAGGDSLGMSQRHTAQPRPMGMPSFQVSAETEPPLSAPIWANLQTRMHCGSIAELEMLARLRHLPVFAGLQLASNAGQLWFAEIRDRNEYVTAWIITDSERRVAQSRRLDGLLWLDRDGKRTVKSKTLIAKAGNGAWPVGAAEIDGKPFVALVEGGPDFLAAWHFLWLCDRWGDVAPVAVLGAGMKTLQRDALPYFAGKGIWTFSHNDGGKGAAAVFQWTRQFRSAGAAWVKPFDFSAYTLPDRRPCKDLNVLVQCAGFGLGDEVEEASNV